MSVSGGINFLVEKEAEKMTTAFSLGHLKLFSAYFQNESDNKDRERYNIKVPLTISFLSN